MRKKQELTVNFLIPKDVELQKKMKSHIENIIARQISQKLFNDSEFRKEIGLEEAMWRNNER